MLSINPESIELVLEGLANGSLTRAQAVDWAQQMYEQFGYTNGAGPEFRSAGRYFVNYWVVSVDALLNKDCETKGPPYFYNVNDFEE